MTSTPRDALVVGGGIIGLTASFTLAREGWRVTMFDPTPGKGATWAAAGMIAPLGEVAPGEEENFLRQRGALAEWRTLSSRIADVTGEGVHLMETGTLIVGYDASDRRLVSQFSIVATSYGALPLDVSRESHETLFEGLSPRIRHGLLLEGDAWLDPDQAVEVLTRAIEELGVTVVHQQVCRAATILNRVEVRTDDGIYEGDLGILATGATALPQGVGGKVVNSVRPVRGMTVRVQGLDRSSLPTVRAFVRGRSFYMVSRPGGYCVLGASSDEHEELIVEVGDLQRLLRDALDVVPSLEVAAFVETRQGLRPASKDLSPFFEVIEDRWAWSSGHYRHGVTLAPFAAKEILAFAQGLT
ncbi:MAG TPA: FAD-dependent oxidoreductase [Acidimicrobiales bacterium]